MFPFEVMSVPSPGGKYGSIASCVLASSPPFALSASLTVYKSAWVRELSWFACLFFLDKKHKMKATFLEKAKSEVPNSNL